MSPYHHTIFDLRFFFFLISETAVNILLFFFLKTVIHIHDMSTCKTILASEIARPFRQYLKQRIENYKSKPTLVGLLANQDPASKKYAEWTARTCQETGVQFKLMQVDKHDLEHEIVKANLSKDIHGMMIYYPVFGYPVDASIRNKVSYFKDVEGLSQRAIQNIYENKRHYDKNIVPCTPLAIIKVHTMIKNIYI